MTRLRRGHVAGGCVWEEGIFHDPGSTEFPKVTESWPGPQLAACSALAGWVPYSLLIPDLTWFLPCGRGLLQASLAVVPRKEVLALGRTLQPL